MICENPERKGKFLLMNTWHAKIGRGRRGMARLGLLALLAGSTLAGACVTPPEPGPSKDEIWKQVYASRLENLRALDQAFNELGQEYYKLEIEYRNAGREDLAAISRERAKAFHDQHLQFQKRIADLEGVDARLRRGDSAAEVQRSAPSESTPVYTEPTPQPAAPAPAATQAPAAGRTGLVTPARTPTPSPSGQRMSEPIIITDPRIQR